ncbi:uncharacterized protein TRIADDRAFT_22351, partial [Trichoplax adhaerens]
TKSVVPFTEIPMPELFGHSSPESLEPLVERKNSMQRNKILSDIERVIFPGKIMSDVVYDLDIEIRKIPPLSFNSRFECGNLRKVIRVRPQEYDILLNPDINTKQHHQWFYFEVRNMLKGIRYQFNIINCIKKNSQFNYGMQPVFYSAYDAINKGVGWIRLGSNICYYKNHFPRSIAAGGGGMKSYYTMSFAIDFPHSDDTCFLAYHFPYTYSTMKVHLEHIRNVADNNSIYFKCQELCLTLNGNVCNLMTITNSPNKERLNDDKYVPRRPYIFLSARVHPGESNSSWIMKGLLDFITSDDDCAIQLRESYIFKIIPMLNPDGVVNGCHRCSLSGHDLNRCWISPDPRIHPTIYHTKGLIQYMVTIGKSPLIFCDFHGHSRRKNIFTYACYPYTNTNHRAEDQMLRALPRALQEVSPVFSYQLCSFAVEKCKESTARVVLWRELCILRSYTMESTYCGMDQGVYKGYHINTTALEDMGKDFCRGLLKMKDLSLRKVPR